MPESGLPIRVYKEHDTWHVDYGEGETEDHTSREEAEVGSRRGRTGRRAHRGRRGIAPSWALPVSLRRRARSCRRSSSSSPSSRRRLEDEA